VAALSGDVGARALLAAAQGEIIEVAVASRAVTFDVDTPDALTQPD
jgi:CTP:molybdopterin cytidylyltransferase MocA